MKRKRVTLAVAATLGAAGLVGTLPSALAAAGAPVNTSPPTISGTALQGQTLTSSTGSWTRSPTSYAYQWRRCNASGSSCVSITGATANTYILTSLDVGSTLRVVVKASNRSGTGTATSAPTAVVQAPPVAPVNTSVPTIAGVAQDGQTLTASPGGWSGTQPITYAYQWLRCDLGGNNCALIGGATGSSYVVTGADVAGTLEVTVTAGNGGGSASASSLPTGVVQAAPPLNTSLPLVGGVAQDGQTLSASAGSWSGTQPITYAYQWQSCDSGGNGCSPIGGATAATYLLTPGSVGSSFRVVVTASNVAAPGGVSATSAATAVVVPAAPVNTSLPAISGTALDGQTLTASAGGWSGTAPISYAYQWQRCDSSGNSCSPIVGAAASSYMVGSADVGSTLVVAVTASNAGGSTTAVSAPTAIVQAVAPLNTSVPTIGGIAQDGQTLSAAVGSWSGTQPIGYAYQWQRCDLGGNNCVLIGGATASSYTATGADVAGTLEVVVTASNGGGSASATSAPTAIVLAAPPVNTSAPTIGGIAQDGQTLTASPGSWSGTTPISFAYQWQSCDSSGNACNPINGATASTYTPTGTDAGNTLRVAVTASNVAAPGGVSATSAATAVVVPAAPVNTSLPAISGTALDGQTLTASAGGWSGTAPISYAYQWQRCDSSGNSCSPIVGAAASSYMVGSADVGSTLVVAVTAGNAGGSTAAASAATAIVQAVAPLNTSVPTIAGIAQDGQTLSASAGGWSGTQPIGYAYQWQRCDSSGNNCHPIQDAVVATYTANSNDVGSTLEVTVTASNSSGSVGATSAPTATVQGTPPVDSTLPTITGTPQAGLSLAGSTGTWNGTTPITYAYQWQSCDSSGNACNPINGATASTYTPTGTDAGNTLRVAVTAGNPIGSATATSAPTALVQGSSTSGATTVFTDGFESGNFSAWSSVQTAGDGTAVVENSTVKTGSYAAQLSESANSGSKSYVRKTFSSPLQDVTAIGDFDLTQQGPSGTGNVPLFRFFDSSSNRVVSLYRQNVSSGTSSTLYVNYGGTYYATTGKLTLGTWATLGIHLIFNGAASTVTISLNGTQIYSTTSAGLGTAGISTVQIGNETGAQQFTAVVDNVSVQTGSVASTPPLNTSPPTITGTPQSGQTLNTSPGTWSGSQPLNYSYQWQRCDTLGNNCSPVSGVTGASYLLTGSDVGATLDVIVTASNTAGSSTATSAATAVIQPGSLPPNIVALWHMDESSGTTMFDSAGNHNGTLFNVQPGLPGWSGSAYGFSGASSYVSVPSSPELNPGSANITITIHLRTTGTPPPPPADWDIFRKGLYTSVGGEYKMEFQQNGQASCGFEGSGGYAEIQGGPALNDGNWHAISCVKTATQIQLIVDGTLVASQNATIGTIAPSDAVVIGARPGSDWYQGQLDDASIQIG